MIPNERDEDSAGVHLSVSHHDLMASIMPLGNARSKIPSQGMSHVNRPRKSKDKTLNEIANKLEVRPIKLKSSRTGSKLAGSQQNKESKFSKWAGDVRMSEKLVGHRKTQQPVSTRPNQNFPNSGAVSGLPSNLLEAFIPGISSLNPNIKKWAISSKDGVEQCEELLVVSPKINDVQMQDITNEVFGEVARDPATSL